MEPNTLVGVPKGLLSSAHLCPDWIEYRKQCDRDSNEADEQKDKTERANNDSHKLYPSNEN